MTTSQQLAANNVGLAYHIAQRFHQPGGIDLEELISDAFLALVRAANEFDADRQVKFSTFAYVIIERQLIQMLQRRRQHRPCALTEALEGSLTARDDDQERGEEADDAAAIIAELKEQLDGRWFAALRAYHGEGLTLREVGARLNVTGQRARAIINQACRKARKLIDRKPQPRRLTHAR